MTDLHPASPIAIEADALKGVRHGFYTRLGGVSEGLYQGLNTGMGSGDDPARVRENRGLLAEALGAKALVSVHQIHSPDVAEVTEDWGADRPRADAMVTRTPGIALGILTADCGPVLLADAEAGVIGAAHAGWKGALGGVIENTVDTMVRLGATRGKIRAALGPMISQRSYEVGMEFVEQFMDEDPAFNRYFAGGKDPDHAQFDLASFCLHRLRDAGVAEAEWTGHCTYMDPARFYSYRRSIHRSEPDYGRLCAAIVL